MTDPIADMLTRIRNAQAVEAETVVIPFSKVKHEIARILEHTGYIKKADAKGRKTKRVLEVVLKYDKEKNPAMTGLKRISKPGQRVYENAQDVQRVRRGRGIVIVSTSTGIMTGKEAREKHVGGEVLCRIW